MNLGQFKDPVSHMCLAGAVVAYWSLTEEVAGSSPLTVMTNIVVTEFAEKNLRKTQVRCVDLHKLDRGQTAGTAIL